MLTESGVSQKGVRHGMEYAEAEVERLEARIAELEAVVEGVLSLGSATLSRISGGTRLWFAARAALKGDADG